MAFPRVSQCKNWFGLAAFSSRGLSVLFALYCSLSVASPATEETLIGVANDVDSIRSIVADISSYVDNLEAQNTDIMAINSNVLRIRQALDIYLGSASNQSNVASIKSDVGTIKTDLGTIKSDVSTIKTDVGTIKTDVGSIKSDVGLMKSNVATMTSDLGTIKSTSSSIYSAVNAVQSEIADQGRYILGDTTAIKNSVAVLSDIARDLSRIRDTVLNGGVSNGVNRAQLHAELQEVTSRLDNILTVSQRILGRDPVSSNDVAQIRRKLDSLESSFSDFREDDFAPLLSSVSTGVSYLDSIRTDTGMLESYWMPELLDRLDLLVAKTNSASAVGGITVTNQIDFSNLKIWEPFWAWTNVFLQFAINRPASEIESHFADWLDPNGYYVFPHWFGGGNPHDDWIPSLPSFLSMTLGGLYDNSNLEFWSWENLFSGASQGLYDDPSYSNWFWWMSEGVRRQLSRLDASTNYLARVSDGLDQLHTINYEILQKLQNWTSVSNSITREEYTSITNELVSEVGLPDVSSDDYATDYTTNDLPDRTFYFEVADVVEPDLHNDDILDSLEWDADTEGGGLFRVQNNDMQGVFQSWNLNVPRDIGTFEVDLNSESNHVLQNLENVLPGFVLNLYDFVKFIFFVLCIYAEVRYYLSGGKT